MKLLCLSQDAAVVELVLQESTAQGWMTHFIKDRGEVSASVDIFDPELMLIEIDGVEELAWWNASGLLERKPLMFVNKQLNEEFVCRAFESGADGLVPREMLTRRTLAARINAFIKRKGLADNRRFVRRLGMVLDTQRYRVEVAGRTLPLTLTEYKILRALSTEQSSIVNRREIQTQVFGESKISKRSLDVHICALRKKLRPFNLDINSVRGVGYGLNPCAS